MNSLKKVLGFFLSLVFVFTIVMTSAVTVQAEGVAEYTVIISLGNNKDATFNETKVAGLEGYSAAKYRVNAAKDKLTITAPATESYTQAQILGTVDIEGDEFYKKGFRRSGADDLYKGDIAFNEDETYIVAFGIGSVIAYNVKYVDSKGNDIATPVTLYAGKGETVKVAAEHVKGYTPDKETIEAQLTTEGQEFKFVYTEPTEIINEKIVENVVTKIVNGPTKYTYSYEYVDGEPVVSTRTNPGTTVVNNRRESNNTTNDSGVRNNRIQTASTEAGDASDEGAGADDASGDAGTVTIGEDETPKGIVDIEPEDVPKKGETVFNRYIRMLIVVIAIVFAVIFIILITLHMMERKRVNRIDKKRK